MSATAPLSSRILSSHSHQYRFYPRFRMHFLNSSSTHLISTRTRLRLVRVRSSPDTLTRLITMIPRFPLYQTISATSSSYLLPRERRSPKPRTPTSMCQSMLSYFPVGMSTNPLSPSSRFGCPLSSSSIVPTTGAAQRLTGSMTIMTTPGTIGPMRCQTGLLLTGESRSTLELALTATRALASIISTRKSSTYNPKFGRWTSLGLLTPCGSLCTQTQTTVYQSKTKGTCMLATTLAAITFRSLTQDLPLPVRCTRIASSTFTLSMAENAAMTMHCTALQAVMSVSSLCSADFTAPMAPTTSCDVAKATQEHHTTKIAERAPSS